MRGGAGSPDQPSQSDSHLPQSEVQLGPVAGQKGEVRVNRAHFGWEKEPEKCRPGRGQCIHVTEPGGPVQAHTPAEALD
jgi:hypothetical protein